MTVRELLDQLLRSERVNAAVAVNVDRDGRTTVAVSRDEEEGEDE